MVIPVSTFAHGLELEGFGKIFIRCDGSQNCASRGLKSHEKLSNLSKIERNNTHDRLNPTDIMLGLIECNYILIFVLSSTQDTWPLRLTELINISHFSQRCTIQCRAQDPQRKTYGSLDSRLKGLQDTFGHCTLSTIVGQKKIKWSWNSANIIKWHTNWRYRSNQAL